MKCPKCNRTRLNDVSYNLNGLLVCKKCFENHSQGKFVKKQQEIVGGIRNQVSPDTQTIKEIEKEIEFEKNAKTQQVYDHNGKEKYVQRNYKKIYLLQAKLQAKKEDLEIIRNWFDFTEDKKGKKFSCDYEDIEELTKLIEGKQEGKNG